MPIRLALILAAFPTLALAEVPEPVRTEMWQYGELIGGVGFAVFQAIVGWWAIKKFFIASLGGAGRFSRLYFPVPRPKNPAPDWPTARGTQTGLQEIQMRKIINAGKELAARGLNKVAAVGTGMVVLSGEVLAAVPADVTTSLTEAKADGLSIATTVFVAIVALFAFGLMRKALK